MNIIRVNTTYRRLIQPFVMAPKVKAVTNEKQRSISTFFKREKRSLEDNECPATKKAHTNQLTTTPLSPEQQKRMQENKLTAMKKLEENTCCKIDMGESWKDALKPEFTKPYFQQLQDFVAAERKKSTVYPPEKDVFSWTKFTDIDDVKVVIIGQDPYHGPKQAHGLCFSVQIGIPPPPSLVNMYKELDTDITGFEKPKHGYLVGWASQGVLMLNACLTVVASKANSHKDKGWEKFTDATIRWINTNLDGVVFILWGAYAQKKANFVDKKRHLVLSGSHPSPLSAYRGFFGCKHFSKTNEYLKQKGKKEINWNYLPEKL